MIGIYIRHPWADSDRPEPFGTPQILVPDLSTAFRIVLSFALEKRQGPEDCLWMIDDSGYTWSGPLNGLDSNEVQRFLERAWLPVFIGLGDREQPYGYADYMLREPRVFIPLFYDGEGQPDPNTLGFVFLDPEDALQALYRPAVEGRAFLKPFWVRYVEEGDLGKEVDPAEVLDDTEVVTSLVEKGAPVHLILAREKDMEKARCPVIPFGLVLPRPIHVGNPCQ